MHHKTVNKLLGCTCIFSIGCLLIRREEVRTAKKTAFREAIGFIDSPVEQLTNNLTSFLNFKQTLNA